jgi:hypothetical protein
MQRLCSICVVTRLSAVRSLLLLLLLLLRLAVVWKVLRQVEQRERERVCVQGDSGEKINNLGGDSIGHCE